MAWSIEKTIGKIGRERVTPGTKPSEAETVRYESFDGTQSPADIFEGVAWRVNSLMSKCGGIVLLGFIVTFPDEAPFYALKYHGDDAGGGVNQKRCGRFRIVYVQDRF